MQRNAVRIVQARAVAWQTRRQAKEAIIDWLVWYNSRRLHSTLFCMSPMQYEQHWLACQPKTMNL